MRMQTPAKLGCRFGARIEKAELRHARGGERGRNRRAHAARADHERARAFEPETLAPHAAHEAFAVEEISLQAPVGRAPHGVA